MAIIKQTTPYTYFIKWTALNKWYCGVRSAVGCHPDEFWKKYFTSSKIVKSLQKLYGDPDTIEIRKTFDTAHQAILWEKCVLTRMNVLRRDDCLNLNIAGSVLLTTEQYHEITIKIKKTLNDRNYTVAKENNPMWNKIRKTEHIPEGWRRGRAYIWFDRSLGAR